MEMDAMLLICICLGGWLAAGLVLLVGGLLGSPLTDDYYGDLE
jgi:hypothetical protein